MWHFNKASIALIIEALEAHEATVRTLATSLPHFDPERGEEINPMACHHIIDKADAIERLLNDIKANAAD